METFVKLTGNLDFLKHFDGIGTWAILLGNRYAPRGFKLPIWCEDVGLKRMDMVFVYNESIPASSLNKYKKTRGGKVHWDEYIGLLLNKKQNNEAIRGIQSRIKKDVYDFMMFNNGTTTIFTATTPSDQVVRFWYEELNLKDEGYVDEVVEAYDIVHITAGNLLRERPPLIDEALRDMIGSLQLDGLTKNEALNLIVREKLMDSESAKNEFQYPNHFYSIKQQYYQIFN